jgi:hypothetical protein
MPELDAAAVYVLPRVCYSCLILKPLRAKHCPIADRCYPRYDQFCWWTGVPVARGNHTRFLAFLGCCWLLSILWLLSLWWRVSPPSTHEPAIDVLSHRTHQPNGRGAHNPDEALDWQPEEHGAAGSSHASGWYVLFSSFNFMAFLVINLFTLIVTTRTLLQQLNLGLRNFTKNEARSDAGILKAIYRPLCNTDHAHNEVHPFPLYANANGWRPARSPTQQSV